MSYTYAGLARQQNAAMYDRSQCCAAEGSSKLHAACQPSCTSTTARDHRALCIHRISQTVPALQLSDVGIILAKITQDMANPHLPQSLRKSLHNTVQTTVSICLHHTARRRAGGSMCNVLVTGL